jgi:hypothetical protein
MTFASGKASKNKTHTPIADLVSCEARPTRTCAKRKGKEKVGETSRRPRPSSDTRPIETEGQQPALNVEHQPARAVEAGTSRLCRFISSMREGLLGCPEVVAAVEAVAPFLEEHMPGVGMTTPEIVPWIILYAETEVRSNPSPEMQARIRHLETEISRLKDSEAEVEHLKSGLEARVTRDEQLEASQKQLQKQVEELQAKPSEFEDKFVRLLGELTKAKVVLPAELGAARPRGVEQQREAAMRYKKNRKKCHHYKSKAKSLRKQLALVPWFGNISWGRGANWGFETFRFMVKKSDVKNRDFKFDPDSASNACDYFPDLAARELLTLGKKIFPDVPEWGENAMKPDENAHVSEPSSEFTPGTEDESSEGEDS